MTVYLDWFLRYQELEGTHTLHVLWSSLLHSIIIIRTMHNIANISPHCFIHSSCTHFLSLPYTHTLPTLQSQNISGWQYDNRQWLSVWPHRLWVHGWRQAGSLYLLPARSPLLWHEILVFDRITTWRICTVPNKLKKSNQLTLIGLLFSFHLWSSLAP